MNEPNKITKDLLSQITDTPEEITKGAYNIRENSGCAGRHSTDNIKIESKADGTGIDIIVAPGTNGDGVYIPACITKSDVNDLVYNDFHIGEGANVRIVAGCGVHADGEEDSSHEGIHRFFVGKNAKVYYYEKHIGVGSGEGKKIINPITEVFIEEGGYLEMDTVQLGGVTSSKRRTRGKIGKDGRFIIREKIMTHDDQYAETDFFVDLDGENSATDLVSRSVAKDNSKQLFNSVINGNAACTGHSECDAIIMDNSVVTATPALTANHIDAELIHEAAIGKIASEQLIKLESLGLTEEQAERTIIDGFLK